MGRTTAAAILPALTAPHFRVTNTAVSICIGTNARSVSTLDNTHVTLAIEHTTKDTGVKE